MFLVHLASLFYRFPRACVLHWFSSLMKHPGFHHGGSSMVSLPKIYNNSNNNIGFLGQIRQMSSQFHYHACEFKLFCLSSCYWVSNSEFGHSISFWDKSNSFNNLFSLAYRHSFSWHTRLKKRLRIWMLLWKNVKLNDYFVTSNDATLHLTYHKTKSNDPFQ